MMSETETKQSSGSKKQEGFKDVDPERRALSFAHSQSTVNNTSVASKEWESAESVAAEQEGYEFS